MTKRLFEQLTDAQWCAISESIDWELPLERGQPRTDLRKIWNSIFYVLTRGCRWEEIPADREIYAHRATAHRWLQMWQAQGIFDRVLSNLLQTAVSNQEVDLTQMAVDGSFSPWCRRRRRGRSRLQG